MTTLEPGCGPLAATAQAGDLESDGNGVAGKDDETVPPLAFPPLQLAVVLQ